MYLSFNIIILLPQLYLNVFPLCMFCSYSLCLREVDWQSAFADFFVVFLSFHLTPKPTHNIPPESHANGAGSAFARLQTTLDWTAKPNRCVWKASIVAREGRGGETGIYIGDPSRLTTDEPPSFSARVCRSLRSSKPFTCHSCLIPEIGINGQNDNIVQGITQVNASR